uniref:Uncharacterized protein n=1 Tax=Avena sativa TaxID=4498 RepID=A0ACD5YEP1_AVESA
MDRMKDQHILEELLVNEILPRLPVKSLLRFKSVCKAWHSTISNRDFIESHRHHSLSEVHVLHFLEDIPPHGIGSINVERLTQEGQLQHYYRLPQLQNNDLINSCHGLVVIHYKDYGYLLSNPAIQESVYLPHPPSWSDDLLEVVGVGFVSSLGKYKVVHITCDSQTEDTCEVFTVGMDNSWRIGKTPPSSIYKFGHTPYVNGNLHKLTESDKDVNTKILVFSLEKETWIVMTLPDHPRIPQAGIYCWHIELTEIKGLLCFICCIQNKSIDIWMLRDYGNKFWSKDFVIDMTLPRAMPDGLSFQISDNYGYFPLNVTSDGRILLQMNVSFFSSSDRDLKDPFPAKLPHSTRCL